jgi:hypothetical protein
MASKVGLSEGMARTAAGTRPIDPMFLVCFHGLCIATLKHWSVPIRIPTMHTSTPPFLRCAIGMLVLASAPLSTAWANYDDGVAAYQRGHFDLAIKAFGDASARGDARAKRSLGLMHERGEGVPRDVEAAAEWYRKAIALGLEGAQYNLAFVTLHGAARGPGVQIATSRP